MRQTRRLFAAVKPVAARYLQPGAPTGLTGLTANASPRATLLYLYTKTLAQLQPIPATSVYRQSVEAVTKHRMAAVEAVQPAGYAAWQARAEALLKAHPGLFDGASTQQLAGGSVAVAVESSAGARFVVRTSAPEVDVRYQEWDGEVDAGPTLEGPRRLDEKMTQTHTKVPSDGATVTWEDEPQLTIEQIEELENKIGAGLIEEVIQVAEGELKLVDTMIQGKVWESLDEKPAEGQWEYFERKS
ncbi:unnamed protein product [Discula destructiva]